MKKILRSFSVLAIAGLFVASCSKEYQPIDDPNNGSGANPLLGDFSCTFWGADNFVADEKLITETQDENGIRTVHIYAKQYSDSLDPTVYRIVDITIDNFNGPGDYTVGSATNGLVTFGYNKNSVHMYRQINNQPGSFINFSQADGKNYKGTFQFDAKDIQNPSSDVQVTNGEFSLVK